MVRAPWRVQLVPGKASIALIALCSRQETRDTPRSTRYKQSARCPGRRQDTLDSTTKSTSSDKRRVSATAASLCARVSIGAINGKSARSRHDQEPNERPYKIGDMGDMAHCTRFRLLRYMSAHEPGPARISRLWHSATQVRSWHVNPHAGQKAPSGLADARFLRAPAVRLQDC